MWFWKDFHCASFWLVVCLFLGVTDLKIRRTKSLTVLQPEKPEELNFFSFERIKLSLSLILKLCLGGIVMIKLSSQLLTCDFHLLTGLLRFNGNQKLKMVFKLQSDIQTFVLIITVMKLR